MMIAYIIVTSLWFDHKSQERVIFPQFQHRKKLWRFNP